MEIILALIGIIVTIIFSLKEYKKTKIAMSDIELFNFAKENFEKFEHLKITFNDIVVTENLAFIKCLVYVVGEKDIPVEAIERGIVIKGTENTRFLDFNIRKSNYTYGSENRGHEVEITAGILKVNDYILFDAVCENLKSKLKVEHRILNTGNTKRIDYSLVKDSWQTAIGNFILGIIMLSTMLWQSSSFPSVYDFKQHYYVDGVEKQIESLDNNEEKFFEGWNAAIDTVTYGIDAQTQGDSLAGDRLLRLLSKRINLYKNSYFDPFITSYKRKEASNELLDSIIKSTNFITLFWSGDYRERHKLNKSMEVSFELDRYILGIVNLFTIAMSIFFLFRAINSALTYFKYELPIKKLLDEENT